MVHSRVLLVLAFVFLALFSVCVADDEESDVLALTSESFESAITDNELIAVEFYSPTCGHCKSLAPEWAKAATQLKGKVPLAALDCTANQDVCTEQSIQGYPTIKLFRAGESTVMEVARKAEAIVNYLTREMKPAITVLASTKEVEEFHGEHPLVAVAYLDNDHDDRWTTFKSVATKKRHTLSFVAVLHAEGAPSLTLLRNFDEPKVVYDGEWEAEDITLWISRNLLATLGEISADTFPMYMAADIKVLGYLFVDPNDASTPVLLKELEPKLVQYKNDFRVAWINNNKYAQQAKRLGLSSKIPSLALDNHQEGARFIFPEDQTVTTDTLTQWLAEFKEGKVAPFVKSEPIPESNDGPVKVLVAHIFKDIVYDTSKDVLVEFYAPWCGHCKSLAPTWEELGSTFANVPSVVIAKVDATANDVPPKLNIRGFPTIIYFPSNNKDTPVEYQGPRSLEDLVRFVKENAGTIESDTPPADDDKADDNAGAKEKDEL